MLTLGTVHLQQAHVQICTTMRGGGGWGMRITPRTTTITEELTVSKLGKLSAVWKLKLHYEVLKKNWEWTQMNPINIYLHVLECNVISVARNRLNIQCLIPHAQLDELNTAHDWIYFYVSLRFYGLCLTWRTLTQCGWTLTVSPVASYGLLCPHQPPYQMFLA
jgi:hypothetical protein